MPDIDYNKLKHSTGIACLFNDLVEGKRLSSGISVYSTYFCSVEGITWSILPSLLKPLSETHVRNVCEKTWLFMFLQELIQL